MSNTTNKIIPGCESRFYNGDDTGCLLLHGFTGSPFEMRYLAESLNKSGFTVSAPLLPGHGTSPRDLKKARWPDWWEEAKKALFELKKKCKRVIVSGFSMGGALSLHLAAHYEVSGIIALAPGLYLKHKLSPLSHILYPVYPYYSKKRQGIDMRGDETILTYSKIPTRSISELLKFFGHLKFDLKDVYAPLLIIHARQDHVIDGKSANEIYKSVSSKNKRILELQESYHIITLDIEREKIYREMSEFLDQIL